jgi:hypothetical protein
MTLLESQQSPSWSHSEAKKLDHVISMLNRAWCVEKLRDFMFTPDTCTVKIKKKFIRNQRTSFTEELPILLQADYGARSSFSPVRYLFSCPGKSTKLPPIFEVSSKFNSDSEFFEEQQIAWAKHRERSTRATSYGIGARGLKAVFQADSPLPIIRWLLWSLWIWKRIPCVRFLVLFIVLLSSWIPDEIVHRCFFSSDEGLWLSVFFSPKKASYSFGRPLDDSDGAHDCMQKLQKQGVQGEQAWEVVGANAQDARYAEELPRYLGAK